MNTATRTRSEAGFKRSELALVGVVSLLVLAVGLSFYVQKRREAMQKHCIANLKQMDGALDSWGLEYRKTLADTYSLADTTVLAFLKGSALPVCPAGGRYSPGATMFDPPMCDQSGHSIPPGKHKMR